MYPTFAEWAGVKISESHILDGENLLPLIEKGINRERPIFWYTPVYLPGDNDYAFRNTPGAAIRDGDYKLIWWFDEPSAELYNLTTDISEKNDLAKTEPEVYAELYAELKAWLKSTNAEICSQPNPLYDSAYAYNKYERIRY